MVNEREVLIVQESWLDTALVRLLVEYSTISCVGRAEPRIPVME
jgi:hypothetical protein